MLKTIPALAALGMATALVVPTVGYAADTASARVSYADLNLATDDGQQTLIRRMSYTADQLCGVGRWKALGLVQEATNCSKDAMAGAQPAYETAVAAARHGTVIVGGAAALVITAR